MENLTCKGLSAAHRRMLIKCITEEIGSIPEPVEIEFMEPIRRKQYSSLWYGGQIAAIRVHGCVFEVHALGDVYAWLYDKSDRDRELLYVKDKNNSGRFGSDIQPYLKTDHALVAAICRKHNRYWIDTGGNVSSVPPMARGTISCGCLTATTFLLESVRCSITWTQF